MDLHPFLHGHAELAYGECADAAGSSLRKLMQTIQCSICELPGEGTHKLGWAVVIKSSEMGGDEIWASIIQTETELSRYDSEV